MRTNPISVFLLHDSPELQPAIELCAQLLSELADFPLETVFLTGTTRQPENASSRPKKELREGDAFILLSRDESDAYNERFVRAQCERAIERQVAIFPIIPKSHREQRRSIWRRQLIESYSPITLDFTLGDRALATQATSIILHRLRLSQPGTDLLGRTLENGTPDALASLIELAGKNGSEQTTKGPCKMAVKAMQARLLPTAISCLELASKEHATSPIIPYWAARLRLSGNSKEEAAQALVESSRAARLADIEEGPKGFSKAAWMLASRAAYMTGDGNAALACLREAMAGRHTAKDWIEVARRNAEMQHAHRALASFEEAFRLDVSIYLAAQKEPEFNFIEEELKRLNTELRERALTYVKTLVDGEGVLQNRAKDVLEIDPKPAAEGTEETLLESETDLMIIIQHGQESFQRQLNILSEWATYLTEGAHQHAILRTQLLSLPDGKPALPQMDRLDDLLARLWPPLQRQWERVEAAAAYQEELRQRLADDDERLSKILPTSINNFLDAVGQFEETVLHKAPFALLQNQATTEEGDLVISSESEAAWPLDTRLLPLELTVYLAEDKKADSKARLLRLKREAKSGVLTASHCAAYFR